MRIKIRKWGNSLGLRIPKSLAEALSVKQGSSVEISVENGRLVVAPIRQRRYDLQQLLQSVTPENLHAESDFGAPQGREAW